MAEYLKRHWGDLAIEHIPYSLRQSTSELSALGDESIHDATVRERFAMSDIVSVIEAARLENGC